LPYLPHLINFSLIPFLLQVNQLLYTRSPEKVVAAADSLLEPEPRKQAAQIAEIDVGIRLSLQNPRSKFFVLIHTG